MQVGDLVQYAAFEEPDIGLIVGVSKHKTLCTVLWSVAGNEWVHDATELKVVSCAGR